MKACSDDNDDYVLYKLVYNRTLLFKAAENGNVEVVRWLLTESGIDTNTKDDSNRTLLHLAAFNGHTEVVRLVKEFGVNPNVMDTNDQTTLHHAAGNIHMEPIQSFKPKIGADR